MLFRQNINYSCVMFIGERINKLLEERKITKVNLYTSIGISGPGLDKMIA